MPIQVECDCGKKLNVPDNLAGKKVKCPGCQNVIEAPLAVDIEYVKPPIYKHPAIKVLGLLFIVIISIVAYRSRLNSIQNDLRKDEERKIEQLKNITSQSNTTNVNAVSQQKESNIKPPKNKPENITGGMTVSIGDDEDEDKRKKKAEEDEVNRIKKLVEEERKKCGKKKSGISRRTSKRISGRIGNEVCRWERHY